MIPDRRPAERAAILAYGLGVQSLTAVFGLRTVLAQPDYLPEDWQLRALAIHGAAELLLALLFAFIAMKVRSERAARAVIMAPAAIVLCPKTVLLLFMLAIRESNPWTYSGWTQLLSILVSIPVAASFMPVVMAVFAARGGDGQMRDEGAPPRVAALDRPLEVRAALFVWLFTVGLATVVLGPDSLVRLWGAIVLAFAAIQYLLGAREERAFFQWAQRAVDQGPPAFVLLPEPPADTVPTLYPDHARKSTLFEAGDQTGTYRKDPSRRPVAALDPLKLAAPRRFIDRVRARAFAPIVYTSIAVAASWFVLHDASVPPRTVAEVFDHHPLKRDTTEELDGLTFWQVTGGPRDLLVAYDPIERRVIQGDELFHRFRARTPAELATLAQRVLYNGNGTLLQGADPGWPKDTDGDPPKAPYVERGTLHFWLRYDAGPQHQQVPVTPEMVRDEQL